MMVWLLLSLMVSMVEASDDRIPTFPTARHACTDHEEWTFGRDQRLLNDQWRKKFERTLDQSGSYLERFTQAVEFKDQSQVAFSGALSRYWIGRNQFGEKQYPLAQRAFESVLMEQPNDANMGIQVAALECLNQIHSEVNHYKIAPQITPQLVLLPLNRLTSAQREVAWESAFMIYREQIAAGREDDGYSRQLEQFLRPSGQLYDFVRGLTSAKRGDAASAVTWLHEFLSLPMKTPLISSLKPFAIVLLARSLYKQERYDLAARTYQWVDRKSNLYSDALTEGSWAYLMNEDYSRSVGASLDLLSSGLRTTFSPESSMVMAMSFVELCQFPSALKSVDQFKKVYRDTYTWLYKWNQNQVTHPISLYDAAIDYLKSGDSVPNQVGTEWLRSPVFITGQEEINFLSKTSKSVDDLIKQVRDQASDSSNQSRLALNLLRVLRDYRASIPVRTAAITAEIEADFAGRNRSMLRQLSEIAANNAMIEIETFQGISKEMLFRKANPDYAQLEGQLKVHTDQQKKKPGVATWDWGRAPASEDSPQEVWEDELGYLRAHVQSDCAELDRAKRARPTQ